MRIILSSRHYSANPNVNKTNRTFKYTRAAHLSNFVGEITMPRRCAMDRPNTLTRYHRLSQDGPFGSYSIRHTIRTSERANEQPNETLLGTFGNVVCTYGLIIISSAKKKTECGITYVTMARIIPFGQYTTEFLINQYRARKLINDSNDIAFLPIHFTMDCNRLFAFESNEF